MVNHNIYYKENDVLLSSKQILELLKMSKNNLRLLKKKKLIKPIRVENKIFYKLSEILDASSYLLKEQ